MNYVFNQQESGAQEGRLDFLTKNARGLDVQVFLEWRRNTQLLDDSRRGWVKVHVYRPSYINYGYFGKSECGLGDTWSLERGLEVAWERLEANVSEVLEQNENRLYKPLGVRTKEALTLVKDLKRAVWAYLFQVDIEKVSIDVSFGEALEEVDRNLRKDLDVAQARVRVLEGELGQEISKVDNLKLGLRGKNLWINTLLTAKSKLQAEVVYLKAKAQDDADLFEDQLGQKDLEICDLKKQLANERKLYSFPTVQSTGKTLPIIGMSLGAYSTLAGNRVRGEAP